MKELIAQNWLNAIPNKSKIKWIGGEVEGVNSDEVWELKDSEILKGDLEIKGFPNLETVNLSVNSWDGKGSKGSLKKVVIKNCPSLKKVYLTNNLIDEVDVSGLSNLVALYANSNKLGKINVKGCEKLRLVATQNRKNENDKGTEEKWEGFKDLKNVTFINSDAPFIPVKTLENWETIVGPDGLEGISNSDGTINKNKLKNYKEAIKQPTQQQLNDYAKLEKQKVHLLKQIEIRTTEDKYNQILVEINKL